MKTLPVTSVVNPVAKIISKALIFATLNFAAIFSSSLAQAEDSFFVGVDTGIMNATGDSKSPTNVAIVVGMNVENGFGFEVQYSSSVNDGELVVGTTKVNYDIKTLAAYAAYRKHFTKHFYGKAKVGVIREELNGIGETGGSYGIGLGYSLGNNMIELEATRIERDINFISLGYKYNF